MYTAKTLPVLSKWRIPLLDINVGIFKEFSSPIAMKIGAFTNN